MGGSDEIHPRHRFLPLLPAGCSHPEACAAAWASLSPQLPDRRLVGAFMAARHPPKPRLALQPVRPGCPERRDYPAAEADGTAAAPRRATSKPWSGSRALQLQSQTGVPGAGLLHAHRLPAVLTPMAAASGSPHRRMTRAWVSGPPFPAPPRGIADCRDLRASAKNNSTSYWSFGPPSALHPPAHISICADECALMTNQNPSPYCGIISCRDPYIMPTRPPRIQHAEYRDAGPIGLTPCDCRCSNA
jgi:hypothetical protein